MVFRFDFGRFLCAAALLVAVAGCGAEEDNLGQVNGTLTYNGEPLSGVMLTFTPDDGGRPAIGTTDAQGKFTLTTYEPDDGAKVGRHTVTLAPAENDSYVEPTEGSEETGDDEMTYGDAEGDGAEANEAVNFPEKYMHGDSTDLVAEIKDGENAVTFDLTD